MQTELEVVTLLRRVAAGRGGTATVILLTESAEEIPCRDERQALEIERLYTLLTQGLTKA